MIKKESVYNIGRISKTHGLKGEVVFNFTDDIFDRTDSEYLICEIDGILVPFFMEEYRFRSEQSALVKFEDLDSADDVKQIVGCDVYLEKSKAEESGEGEMSLNYFIGFSMVDTQGQPIGKIVDVDDNTDNWLFVVEREDGSEVLVPAHEEFIAEIRQEYSVMVMNLPLGLLDL